MSNIPTNAPRDADDEAEDAAEYEAWIAANREDALREVQAVERRWKVVRIGFCVLAAYLLIQGLIDYLCR